MKMLIKIKIRVRIIGLVDRSSKCNQVEKKSLKSNLELMKNNLYIQLFSESSVINISIDNV